MRKRAMKLAMNTIPLVVIVIIILVTGDAINDGQYLVDNNNNHQLSFEYSKSILNPFGSKNKCAKNSRFSNCGTVCPYYQCIRNGMGIGFCIDTEENKDNCVPGCYCKKNYFRTCTGECVPESSCRMEDTNCGLIMPNNIRLILDLANITSAASEIPTEVFIFKQDSYTYRIRIMDNITTNSDLSDHYY